MVSDSRSRGVPRANVLRCGEAGRLDILVEGESYEAGQIKVRNGLKGVIPMPQVSGEEMSYITNLFLKALAVIGTFLSGVVTTVWVVARKFQGFEDRLTAVEQSQAKCQGQTLVKISEKIEAIPQQIEEKMDKRFERVHERFDEFLLRKK